MTYFCLLLNDDQTTSYKTIPFQVGSPWRLFAFDKELQRSSVGITSSIQRWTTSNDIHSGYRTTDTVVDHFLRKNRTKLHEIHHESTIFVMLEKEWTTRNWYSIGIPVTVFEEDRGRNVPWPSPDTIRITPTTHSKHADCRGDQSVEPKTTLASSRKDKRRWKPKRPCDKLGRWVVLCLKPLCCTFRHHN